MRNLSKLHFIFLFAVFQLANVQTTVAAMHPAADSPPLSDPNIRYAMSRRLKQKVKPIYPEGAKAALAEGTVSVAMIVRKDGTVRDVSAQGLKIFSDSAIEAVSHYVYEPFLLNGQAVEVQMYISIEYSLKSLSIDPLLPLEQRSYARSEISSRASFNTKPLSPKIQFCEQDGTTRESVHCVMWSSTGRRIYTDPSRPDWVLQEGTLGTVTFTKIDGDQIEFTRKAEISSGTYMVDAVYKGRVNGEGVAYGILNQNNGKVMASAWTADVFAPAATPRENFLLGEWSYPRPSSLFNIRCPNELSRPVVCEARRQAAELELAYPTVVRFEPTQTTRGSEPLGRNGMPTSYVVNSASSVSFILTGELGGDKQTKRNCRLLDTQELYCFESLSRAYTGLVRRH